jgi:hypothetical protein
MTLPTLITIVLAASASVLVRFWRLRDEERQQRTWLAYAAIFWVSVGELDVMNQCVVHDPVVD